ncbi:MAG: hypothetical protein HY897_00705, partial [Deltaproteobacteria bacterium]|nr:hypothetical protein [Deltaproteobacteria bacterium]
MRRAGGNLGFVALTCSALAACHGDRSNVPAGAAPAAVASPTAVAGAGELRFAVAAMVSPAVTWESYEGILRYISDSLGKPYRLIQRRTYREINDLLLAG